MTSAVASKDPNSDTDLVWSDAHFRYCWAWLLTSDQSPYKGSPAMIVHGLGVPKHKMRNWKFRFRKTEPFDMAFATRMRMTARFKKVMNGLVETIAVRRDKLGRVLECEVRPVAYPKPLNCPPFYRGSISMGRNGMKVILKRTDAIMAPKHNPEGIQRLTNPFGVR